MIEITNNMSGFKIEKIIDIEIKKYWVNKELFFKMKQVAIVRGNFNKYSFVEIRIPKIRADSFFMHMEYDEVELGVLSKLKSKKPIHYSYKFDLGYEAFLDKDDILYKITEITDKNKIKELEEKYGIQE